MALDFQAGDVLIFQIESGYALLHVLAVDDADGQPIWHLAAYADLFMDVDAADEALGDVSKLSKSAEHLVLTNRAFESTQTARMTNIPLSDEELRSIENWRSTPDQIVSDRSVRLMLGLR